jgi:hypothetical protein
MSSSWSASCIDSAAIVLETLPLWPAYLLTTVLFGGLALFSLRVPRAEVLRDAPDHARWRDIRWWAVALITVQLALYVLFS